MNKHTHRLVFCRHRGMRVPAAENTRSAGKAAGGQTRATAVSMVSAVVLGTLGWAGLPGGPGQEAQARTLVGSVPSAQGTVVRRGHQAWLNRTHPGSNLPVRSTDSERIKGNSPEGEGLHFQMKTLDDGRRLLIDQYKRQIIINWDSFNIAPGYMVEFDQVSGGTALNKIWDLKPSVILGSIKANGEVILESQNGGFIFGNGARVDAQRFVASALALTSAWTDGLRQANPAQDLGKSLVFDGSSPDVSAYYRQGDAEGLVRGVVVEPGAEIRALAGGDVILVGPSVVNAGRIETPDGQTVLAAGQKVYMMSAAADPTQRGLVVAVDAYAERTINELDAQGQPVKDLDESRTEQTRTRIERIDNSVVNVAENAAGGTVEARRGLINLVGLAVRQNGVLSATTAVKGDNGVITLEAASEAAFIEQSWKNGVDNQGQPRDGASLSRPLGQQMGSLTFGAGSRTEITPDGPRAPQTAPVRTSFAAGPEGDSQFNQAKAAYEAVTQTDSEVFLRSRISAMGKDVTVQSGATLAAPAGLIELQALSGARGAFSNNTSYLINPSQGSAPEADDSRLTIEAGANVTVAGLTDVSLPTQRNQLSGRLFSSELADAPVQRGGVLYRQAIKADAGQAVTVANVKGLYDGLRRDAWEWMTVGGHITLATQGQLGVSVGSVLDVSGGSVKYEAGTVGTTLLRKGDRVLTLAQANPGERYDELIVSADGTGRYVGSFIQGFDAGSLTLSGVAGMAVSLAGVKGDVLSNLTQRNGKTAEQWAEALRKAGTLGANDKALTHPANSRAIGRPTALNVAPHLYASLRPMPMTLALGQTVGQSEAFSLQRGLTLGGQTARPGHDLIDLSALRTSLGALQVAAPQVAVAPGATLPVAAGGQVRMESLDALDFGGTLDAPQATVALKSRQGDVTLSGTAQIDLAGDQVDLQRRGVVAPEVLAVDGGSLSLNAGLSVLQQAGSVVNLSAGLVREATGDTRQGKAGQLSVGLNEFKTLNDEGQITLAGAWQMAGTLKAFDFHQGGSLSVSGLRTLTLVDADGNLADSHNDLQLASGFFSDHGFGKFSLKAIGDVAVASGVNLTPVLRNLAADFRQSKGELAKETVLDEKLRSGLQLSLQAQAAPAFALKNDGGAYKGMDQAASVRIGEKATVNMGAGGRIGLTAAGSVHVAGSLVARGGAVALALSGARGGGTASAPDAGGDKVGYLPDQQIVLSGAGKIDVSGIDRTRALSNGRRDGVVLAGGTVSFNAQGGAAQAVRGKVITEAKSQIWLDGAQGALSFGRGQSTALFAGAGALSIESADGVLLQGTVSAKALDASVEGGRLSVSLSREGFSDDYLRQRDGDGNTVSQDHLGGERTLRVSARAPKDLTQPEASATTALVSAELINNSGFEQVQLRAEGRVVLENNVSLGGAASSTPLRALAIDSPVLQLEGTGTHRLQATRVALGDATNPLKAGQTTAALPAPTMADPAADAAQATLEVNAGLIEVHGHSVLQGVDRTKLHATLGANHQTDTRTDGEVRLIGRTQDTNSSGLTGSLNFAGDLLMRAGQVYATTLSQFSVLGQNVSYKVEENNQVVDKTRFARIEVKAQSPGSTSRTPLSALAQLKLQAHTLDIDGVLRQPFGAIALKGEGSLTLGANSALSVSGEGLTVPVGRTIEGTTWVYTPQGIGPNGGASLDQANVVQQLGAANLVKGIHVDGAQLTVDPQSRMEAQAGGQLLAWEFLEGVMGSKNTLSRPGVYAIVPGYTHDFAPHDTEILATQAKAGTDGTVGKRITLAHDVTRTDANGQQVLLPKGTYTLLPAEYAVLPGALLVSAIDQGSGAPTQSAIAQDDGGVRVGGYFTAAGTRHTQGNDPRLAFLVEPEDTVRQQSDLSITSVAQLLSRNAAKRAQALPGLPGDAGRVSLQSTSGFDWAARYNLAGGQFDLAMGTNMALVANADVQAADEVHQVSAEQLAATQAASVLLGGVRSGSTSAQEVTTLATSVEVLTDHGLAAEGQAAPAGELILAAKKNVTVAEGKTLQANGTDTGRENDITFKGAGTALVVSHLANTAVRRVLGTETPDAAATLTLRADAPQGQARQAGAILRGAAIDLDSTGSILGLDGTVATLAARGDSGATVVETRRLGLGAQSLAVLQADATLTDREQLTLRSPGSITLQTGSTLGSAGMQRLVLDAPELKGSGQGEAVARITAQQVVLRNSSGVAPGAGDGTGNLLVEAAPPVRDATADGIRIEGGLQRLAFAKAELTTKGDIVFAGQGQLAAQGALDLTAARITAETGARHGAKAEGALTIAAATNARTLGDVVGTGAKLAFTGQSIAQKGRIELTSGQIDLAGTNGVELAKRSLTSAAGARIQQGDRAVAATGGGAVSVVSTQGQVQLMGVVDVSAPQAADLSQVGVAAGSIRLEALGAKQGLIVGDAAQLKGRADQLSQSGRLDIDAARVVTRDVVIGSDGKEQSKDTAVGSLDRLAALAQAGGMGREVSVRTTEGNLTLQSVLSAGRVSLTADDTRAGQGQLILGHQARIDTTQAAPRGGVVLLAAQNRVALQGANGQGAEVTAGATTGQGSGGDMLVHAAQGVIQIDQGASINAGKGRVVLRSPLNEAGTALRTLGNDWPADERTTRINGGLTAGEVSYEAVKVAETIGNLTLGSAQMTSLKNAASAFYTQRADSVRSGLGLQTGSALKVRYGHELRSTGNMTLAADWNLYTAGSKSFDLTLRAGGDLTLNGHLSDGFATAGPAADSATTPTAMDTDYKAASMRLVAGADISSAQTMRTLAQAPDASGKLKGHLTVAGSKVVRTTDGSVELASGANTVLQEAGAGATLTQAAVYVAGRPVAPTGSAAARSTWQRFTQQGGRLEVHARGDITAPAAIQGFGNWLLHTGNNDKEVAWASDFDAFRQGLGSMGGGDLRVVAGGNIRNLTAAAPTSLMPTLAPSPNGAQVQNGGHVTVRAGGDIAGGMYLLGRGQGALEAAGQITVGDRRTEALSASTQYQAMAPVLGLMDGQWRLQAMGDAQVSAVYNPTALSGATDTARVTSARSVMTYSDDAAVSIHSLGGGVAWRADLLQGLSSSNAVQAASGLLALHTSFGAKRNKLTVGNTDAASRQVLQTLPGSFEVMALGALSRGGFPGNTSVAFELPQTDLLLAPSAKGQFRVHGAQGVRLAQPESGGRRIAMLDFDPAAAAGGTKQPVTGSVNWSATNTFAVANLHRESRTPAMLTAGGDIDFRRTSLSMPKALAVLAQGDILNPAVRIQHHSAQDISRIEAGGSVVGADNGQNPSRPLGLMQLNGPGELQVQAGLSLDLRTAGGIEATGDGASLRVASGMRRQVKVDELVAEFLAPDAQARAQLVQYVQTQLAVDGLAYEQALALFRDMTPEHQNHFAMKQLVLPKFAREYVQLQAGTADPVWAWLARAGGVSVADQGSALYAEYQAAQRTLVTHVQNQQGLSGLSFEQALAQYRLMSNADKATLVDKRRSISPLMAMAFLAAEPSAVYAQAWQQRAAALNLKADDFASEAFQRFAEQVLLKEVQRIGSVATAVADSANELFNPRRAATRDAIWAEVSRMATAAGLNRGFDFQGDTDLSRSKVHLTGASGAGQSSIDMFTPGGKVLVGSVTATAADAQQAATRGLAAYGGGDVRSYSKDDFLVASQKVHIVGSGDIMLYSAEGDIDSGRGSNNAVTVPPKVVVVDAYGTPRWTAGKTTVGSGMAIFVDGQGRREGKISLLAPRGEVRALDAFIDAPSIELAGPVIGGDNLQGSVAGSAPPPPAPVPVAVNTGLGAETAAGEAEKTLSTQKEQAKAPSSLLTVDVLGLGDAALPATAAGEPARKEEDKATQDSRN